MGDQCKTYDQLYDVKDVKVSDNCYQYRVSAHKSCNKTFS